MEITSEHLLTLWDKNSFPAWQMIGEVSPKEKQLVFGLRGMIPVSETGKFAEAHQVELEKADYRYPSCTIGVFDYVSGQFALFTGSTVPHIKHIRRGRRRGGVGTNEMMTGAFDVNKGTHRYGTDTAHTALRNDKLLPVRRTADDLDYDFRDKIHVQRTYNNIHCAYSQGITHNNFESAGCTVICGYPHLPNRFKKTRSPFHAQNHGDWAKFHEIIYDQNETQRHFDYFLLNGRDVARVVAGNYSNRLRFGSQGNRVKKLQRALQERDFYKGITQIDGDFGVQTFKALIAFQKSTFGARGTDGIVGQMTSRQLNFEL